MESNYLKNLATGRLVVLLALLCLPLAAMATSAFGGGDGTENNPYQIKTEDDLKQLATDVNGGNPYADTYFKLMNNITLTGEWTPIGITKDGSTNAFSGKFDGDKHSILGLCIKTQAGVTTYGLFGITDVATISNLHIQLADDGIQVDATEVADNYYIGAFAGEMKGVGLLANCYLTSSENENSMISVEGNKYVYIGGLAGALNELFAGGKMENCYSTVSVTVNSSYVAEVGGICGWNNGKISNCYATGAVKSISGTTQGKLGGIAGSNVPNKGGAAITNCLALNSEVVFTGTNLGRITGYNIGVLSGTYASTKIPGTWNNKGTEIGGTDKIDGFDTYIGTYLSDMTWDEDVWITSEENLPILKGFLNQPTLRTLDYLEEGEASPESWADVAKQATTSTTEPTADVYVKVDTFTINSEKGLAWLSAVVNGELTEGDNLPADKSFAGKIVKLGADLDLGKDAYKELSWEPIGITNVFVGKFDGQNHSIKGFWIDMEIESTFVYAGLFGYVDNCMLANLHIQLSSKGIKMNSIVEGTSVGAFIGLQKGQSVLENCYLTAEEGGKIVVTSTGITTVGGMVGEGTIIRNCYSTVPVSATSIETSTHAGGICGIVELALSNCFATGMVEANATKEWNLGAGGICCIARAVLSNNLALNRAAVSGGKVGRIASFVNKGSTLSANYSSTLIAGTWANKGADKLDGADTYTTTFWNDLNGGEANNWSVYVKDENNVNLPKLAGNWSQAQPDLAIADYLGEIPPRITFSQPEAGGVLIVKDSLGKAITSDTLIAKGNVLKLECLPLPGYTLDEYKANGTKVEPDSDSLFFHTVTEDVEFTVTFKTVEIAPTDTTSNKPLEEESAITTPVTTPTVAVPATDLVVSDPSADIRLITSPKLDAANQDTLRAKIKAVGITLKDTLYQDISLVEIVYEEQTGAISSITPVQLQEGKTATLYIPYPAGTDKNYTFTVYHLNWKGEVEVFSTEAGNLVNTDNGLKLTVTSFSPFAIAYKEKEAPTPPPYVPSYYFVTLPEVEGATLSRDPGSYSLVEGSSFSFSLELKEGYKSSVPVVKANDVVVDKRESDGKYVVYSIYSDTEITIEGIVKDTPTGIDSADNTVRVRTVASTLCIYTPAEETVCIFALTGTLCREPLKVWGDAQVQLPAGVYIVRIADKSYKAVIR